MQPKVGHYGVFNGSRFRAEIAPRIADFIATFAQKPAAPRARANGHAKANGHGAANGDGKPNGHAVASARPSAPRASGRKTVQKPA
jgi:poly(3-hydroxybutyrate) depolymerase